MHCSIKSEFPQKISKIKLTQLYRNKPNFLLLLIRCELLLPLWDSVIVLCFVVHYFVSILALHHLDGEERADCFALFVFLVSGDRCVALPHDTTSLFAVCDCGIS